MEKTILAGTYTSKESKGIYRFTDRDGHLSGCELFAAIRNPKYLAQEGDIIAAAADLAEGSGIALLDKDGTVIGSAVYEGETSCYITAKDHTFYTANYHAGTFTRARMDGGTLTDVQTVCIKEKAGCHQVILYEDRILVPCLLLDRVMIFGQDLVKKGEIVFPQGTGPRHGVVSGDGKYLYLVSELSNEFFVIEAGTWQILQAIPVLSDGRMHVEGGAAVRLSEDERHAYVSTREQEVLSVIALADGHASLVQNSDCGGRHPRDFIRVDSHLLVANRFTNSVVSFALKEDRTIGEKIDEIPVPEAVALLAVC